MGWCILIILCPNVPVCKFIENSFYRNSLTFILHLRAINVWYLHCTYTFCSDSQSQQRVQFSAGAVRVYGSWKSFSVSFKWKICPQVQAEANHRPMRNYNAQFTAAVLIVPRYILSCQSYCTIPSLEVKSNASRLWPVRSNSTPRSWRGPQVLRCSAVGVSPFKIAWLCNLLYNLQCSGFDGDAGLTRA